MRPMHIDAIRGMIAMYGGAPQIPPTASWMRNPDAPVHPLQVWVDELVPWQEEQVRLCSTVPSSAQYATQAAWDECWAQAIYAALWY